MTWLLDFFASNYIWFIVAAFVAILALVGRYADKTNFAQKKNDGLIKKDENNIESTPTESISENIEDSSKLSSDKVEHENSLNIIENGKLGDETAVYNSRDIDNIGKIDSEYVYGDSNSGDKSDTIYNTTLSKDIKAKNVVKEQKTQKENFEETYRELDKEISYLLPKKEFLDGELLEDIEDLSLDKTQRIDVSDIPDLDDVDLPKIKNLKDSTEDIWKF